MNIVILSGRLASEPTVKTTSNNKRVLETAIGVRKGYGATRETMWVDLIAFEYTADKMASWLHKGDLFGIRGREDVSSYTDKEGKKRKSVKVIVDEIFLFPNPKKAEIEYEEKPQDTVGNLLKNDMKNRMEDLDKWSTPVFEDAGDLPF